MSGPYAFACRCQERQKPAIERRWMVTAYRCNHSAFNGYRFTPSDWSAVRCERCGANWRTKAAYVEEIPRA